MIHDLDWNEVNLKDFALDRILGFNKTKESFSALGTFRDTKGQAIVVFEKKKLVEEDMSTILTFTRLEKDSQNTIYGFYNAFFGDVNTPQKFKVTVVYPVHEKLIQKYSFTKKIFFAETPEIYQKFTEPYISSFPATHITWLEQLLQKRAEQERFLIEDPDPKQGFVMYAYDHSSKVLSGNLEEFSALVLVNRRDLKSLRDLGPAEIPLLENIKSKVHEFVDDKFGNSEKLNTIHERRDKLENVESNKFRPSDQLRVFFHYKPTYFHLHVHVAHISLLKNEKDYRLEDVIEHMTLLPDYFQKKTLYYEMEIEDPLYLTYSNRMQINY